MVCGLEQTKGHEAICEAGTACQSAVAETVCMVEQRIATFDGIVVAYTILPPKWLKAGVALVVQAIIGIGTIDIVTHEL
jgi:hypothetical protein